MDSAISTPSLDALRTIDFQNGFRGYNVEEVDAFLDKAAEELDALRDQYRQMQTQLRHAADRIKQLEASPKPEAPVATAATPTPAPAAPAPTTAPAAASQEVTSMIAMAQEFVSATQREAVEKATALTTNAQEQARRILEEAKSNALDEVTQLEGRKARLAEEVTTLARFVTAERNRLKVSLGEMAQWLDNALAVRETSAPATPVAPTPTPTQSPAPAAPVQAAPAPTTPEGSNRITTIGEVTQFKLEND